MASAYPSAAGRVYPSVALRIAAAMAKKMSKRSRCEKCGLEKLRSHFARTPSGRVKKRCQSCVDEWRSGYFKYADDEERKAADRARAKLRTPESRRELRRREADRKGKQYRPLAELRAERSESLATKHHALALRAWWSYCNASLSDEERKAHAREKWRAHYRQHRDKEIRRSRDKKRKYRASAKRGGWSDRTLLEIRDSATDCGYCGRSFDALQRHLDHIIPVSDGGPTEAWNLMPACSECNTSKAAKPLHQWLETQPSWLQERAWASVSGVMAHTLAI